MTVAEVLAMAESVGVEVRLRADGSPVMTGSPNEALKSLLKEHRSEIIAHLGANPPPQKCNGFRRKRRRKTHEGFKEEWVDVHCGAIVFLAVDSTAFCQMTGCPFRRTAGGGDESPV